MEDDLDLIGCKFPDGFDAGHGSLDPCSLFQSGRIAGAEGLVENDFVLLLDTLRGMHQFLRKQSVVGEK